MGGRGPNSRRKHSGNNGNAAAASEYLRTSNQKMLVPKLSEGMLELMNGSSAIQRLNSVLLDVALIKNCDQAFSRVQLVHFAINLLLSWMFSSCGNPGGSEGPSQETSGLFNQSTGSPVDPVTRKWLKALLLEDHDPAVRREMCMGLHKMCLGSTPSGTRNGLPTTAPLMSVLLEFLDQALTMKPAGLSVRDGGAGAPGMPGKESYGPAGRDYFWILCRLVDSLTTTATGVVNVSATSGVNLELLARQLAHGIAERKIYERRRFSTDGNDDALTGALNL